MKTAKKLLIAGIVLILFGFISDFLIAVPFGLLCFLGAFVLVVFQGIMEILNKNKAPKSGNYSEEARRACEKVTPKRSKDTTPPWEE